MTAHDILTTHLIKKCPKKFLAYISFFTPMGNFVELAVKHNRKFTKRINKRRWCPNQNMISTSLDSIDEIYRALIKIKLAHAQTNTDQIN